MNDPLEATSNEQFYRSVCERAQGLLEDIRWELEETGAVSEDTYNLIVRHLDMYSIDRSLTEKL